VATTVVAAQEPPDALEQDEGPALMYGADRWWAVLGSNQDDRLRAKASLSRRSSGRRLDPRRARRRPRTHVRGRSMVGGTGIEPATSSVSGKRATAAPTARGLALSLFCPEVRWRRDSNPCGRLCRPLPRLSATPPCVGPHVVIVHKSCRETSLERMTRFEL